MDGYGKVRGKVLVGSFGLQLHKDGMELGAAAGGEEFSEGVLVEIGQEGLQGLVEIALQSAGIDDGAGVGGTVKAFDQTQVGFGVADDIAQADFFGIAQEPNATGAAGQEFDIAVFAQGLDDADEVVLGDTVGVANLPGGNGLAGVRTQIEQHAEGVIGMEAKLHVAEL